MDNNINELDHFYNGISKMGMDPEGFMFLMLSDSSQVTKNLSEFNLTADEEKAIMNRVTNYGKK